MKRIPKEDQAGIYITVIIHLVVLIILLAGGLGAAIHKDNSFLIDFSKTEELEKLQKEVELREAVSKRLQEMLKDGGVPVRALAVDRGALKDDRGTDAEQLYKDALKLQEDMNRSISTVSDEFEADLPSKEESAKENKKSTYSGPSVLSWELQGRKASRLPIPAYRCMGAGKVKVLISVDASGKVIGTGFDETESSKDGCLRDFAKRAARLSRFSSAPGKPKQQGYIIYQFIAQ